MAFSLKNAILLIAILLVLSLTINYYVNNSKLEPSIELGILGSEGKAEKYFPYTNSTIPINTELSWTLYLSNTLPSKQNIQIRVKYADPTTPPPNTTLGEPCPIEPFYTYSVSLKENEHINIPFKFSIIGQQSDTNIKINQLTVNNQSYPMQFNYVNNTRYHLVFEVWTYDNDLNNYIFTWREGQQTFCVWNQLWFQIKIIPKINSINIWSYPDNIPLPKGGSVTVRHTVRIYADILNPFIPVNISYRFSGGPWITDVVKYEPTFNYYYIDWTIPDNATLGFYDVKVDSGVMSSTNSKKFKVEPLKPVVNYIDVWSLPDNIYIDPGGTISRGHTAHIYAGISDPVTPVNISYKLHSTSTWTAGTVAYNSEWDYFYIEWTIPDSAALGSYDVKVETGKTTMIANGRFKVQS